MASSIPARSRSRVECVGPKCGTTVSMVTAQSERWRRIMPSIHPTRQDRRTHIGFCRACSEKYDVEEP